jgi:pimeloyl-ACP methyl ester carboxylesterase
MKHMRIILLYLSIQFSIQPVAAQEDVFAGKWHGTMLILGQAHEVLIDIQKPKKKHTMKLLNPADSSDYGFSFDKVVAKDKLLEFTISALTIEYKGKLVDGVIEGTFTQGGFSAPLHFHRTKQELPKPNRPQEPQAPFDYHTREVKIPHANGKFDLAGTLVLPKDSLRDFPLVVFSTGSGPQDRNEEILGHKLFLVIADHLAKNGIGSLRFDDRGVGESGGKFDGSSLEDFASDLESAYLFLRRNQRFANLPIGLLGHSEGSMHAQMTTKKNQDVAFIVSLAGPGETGRKVLEDQQYLLMIYEGKAKEIAQWNQATYRGMIDIILKYDQKNAQKPLNEFLSKQWDSAPKGAQEGQNKVSFMMTLGAFINNDFGRQFIAWDAAAYLPFFHTPILSVIGSKDFQVPAESNTQGFKNLITEESKKKSKLVVYEGLNHLLQKCEKCNFEEYGTLEETIHPPVLDMIVEFILSIE